MLRFAKRNDILVKRLTDNDHTDPTSLPLPHRPSTPTMDSTPFAITLHPLLPQQQRHRLRSPRHRQQRQNFCAFSVSHLFTKAVFWLGLWTKLCAAICPSPCQCPSPAKVDCSNKRLTQIPSGIHSDVIELDLSGNSISIQPGSFR